LAAAIYMSQAMALLNYISSESENVFERMDQTLRDLMGLKDFLTLCIIEWDLSGQFSVVRAGHPPPIHLSSAAPNAPIQIAPPGLALGMRPAHSPTWHVYEGRLQPGDWVAMYSDGLTEAMDQAGNLYGTDRLVGQLLRFWGTGSPRAACEAIFQQVGSFESQNRDDRTLFILARSRNEN
jgi:serine phosphatase RsbU (regulator of sigma subunit)